MSAEEELARVRAELAEVRQILAAIRGGNLDALLADDGQSGTVMYTRTSAERIYRLIIERMLEGAVTIGSSGIILYCNPSFARMLSKGATELIGSPIAPFLTARDSLPVEALLEASDARRGDFDLAPPGRAGIPVSISASSIEDEEGVDVLRCLVVSDLRLRQDVTRLQQVTEALATANARKNEFLAMLGHELRNPLAPVRQAVELMRERASDDDPPHVQHAAEVIERQVEHLNRLVDDLLDAGRIAQGTMVLRPADTDLRDVVELALESVDRLMTRRGHTVTLVTPSHPVPVHGDVVRLTQVVTNLLSNAAKYTPDGGQIEIVLTQDEAWACIAVRDDGRGISPELLPHLFDPFVRGRTSPERRMGGLGVGLTLVQRLVELHEGRVEARSAGVGCGAEFLVWLPRRPETSPAVDPAPPAATAGATKILVVDDNEDAAEMLTLLLQARGHEVQTAHGGHEALEVEARFEPTVVCLDIGLPDLDGYAVARALRQRRGRNVQLFALTGYGRGQDRVDAAEAGFDRHFVKPISVEDLEAAIAAGSEPSP